MKKIFFVVFLAVFTLSNFAFAQDALVLYRNGRNMEQAGLMDNANSYYSQSVSVCKNELLLNDKKLYEAKAEEAKAWSKQWSIEALTPTLVKYYEKAVEIKKHENES